MIPFACIIRWGAILIAATLLAGCETLSPLSGDLSAQLGQAPHGQLSLLISRNAANPRATQATSAEVDAIVVTIQQTSVSPISQGISASEFASGSSSVMFDGLTSGPATATVTVFNAVGSAIGFTKANTMIMANQTTQLTLTVALAPTITNATFGPGAFQANLAVNDGPTYINYGMVRTIAGATQGYKDGADGSALFSGPGGIAQDATGTLYVADTLNNRIRKITADGAVTTLAGGTQGSADGTGTLAQFFRPSGIAVDERGTLYVSDTFNNRIRKVTPAGVVTTVVGAAQGSADGQGLAATFNHPTGLALDFTGNLYVADTGNHRIRMVTASRAVWTLAGSTAGYTDATGSAAQFNGPQGLAVDTRFNLYVADTQNHAIRKISATGMVTTLAGDGTASFVDGPNSQARFNQPAGVALGPDGSLYVADTADNLIRKLSTELVASTIAGETQSGMADGYGPDALFCGPQALVVGPTGVITVADTQNHRVRIIE